MTRLQQIACTVLGLTVTAYGVHRFARRTVARHAAIEDALDAVSLSAPPRKVRLSEEYEWAINAEARAA